MTAPRGGGRAYDVTNVPDDYAAYIPLIALVALLLLVFVLTSPSTNTIMGALCGKQSNEPFSSPGRTLAAAPPAATTSAVPASARKATGAARTVGSPTAAAGPAEARKQAALAAERRATEAKKSQGRLTTQLNKEKGATQAELLRRQAEENKGHRAMDANAEALRHE